MAKKQGKGPNIKRVKYTIPTPNEETVPISLRLPESLKERLEAFSEKQGIKSSDLIRHILKEFLDAQD